jgi:hypothetical protein
MSTSGRPKCEFRGAQHGGSDYSRQPVPPEMFVPEQF